MGLLLMHFRILSIHARNFITIDFAGGWKISIRTRNNRTHYSLCGGFWLMEFALSSNFPIRNMLRNSTHNGSTHSFHLRYKAFRFRMSGNWWNFSLVFFFLFGSVFILFFALIYLKLIRLLHLLFVSSVLLQIKKNGINLMWQLCIFHFPRIPIIMLSTLIQFIHFANPSSSKM